MHEGFVARMANSDPHAAVVVANMRGDRFEAIVTGIAAAGLDPHPPGRQIKFVVKDHNP